MLRKFEVLEKNWYPFEIVEIDGPKPNKSNNLELKLVVKVLEGDCEGTETQMWFYPIAYGQPFVDLATAIEGVEITAGMEIDPDRWVGKQFWSEALVKINPKSGDPMNEFKKFTSISDGPAF